MSTFQGIGVSSGRVIGPVLSMPEPIAEPEAGQKLELGPEEAKAALKTAATAVKSALKLRAEAAHGDGKAVLVATAQMATDPTLLKSANKLIDSGVSAERAVWEAADAVAQQLKTLGGYMAERAQDIFDVRARIVAELRGVPAPGVPESQTPFVLLAHDLAPADTATLNPAQVLALVSADGGPQSHTAILARTLGLPAVVAASGVTQLDDGVSVFVDGSSGAVISEPGAEHESLVQQWQQMSATLGEFDGHGQLADGSEILLLANIGNAQQSHAAADTGAQGVGLFRTEFLFLDREEEPSVAEQSASYAQVFAPWGQRKIVVRTLDAGADKPLPFLSNSAEPNPALGARGYRTELANPGVLARQLQAIAAARDETGAQVWVMAPMVSTPSEAADFKQLCTQAGLDVAGVMVEVPAAAVSSAGILQDVDFVSIGTNDLTQYTMAADRQIGLLAGFNDPWQPAVLNLVQATTAGAQRQGSAASSVPKPVGVCGEAAADPAYAVVLAGLGVTSLSMTARALAPVAAVLKSVTLEQAHSIAEQALQARTAQDAKSVVRAAVPLLQELGL